MIKREDIIKNIVNDDDKDLIVKIIDCIEQVQRYYEPRFTVFLDPSQTMKSKRILDQCQDIKYSITSGIEGCERNIISIFPDYMTLDQIDLPIIPLSIRSKSKFENLDHRDILGALMNLGIKREKIGDIIINDNKHFIVVYKDISYYIKLNLEKIKHTPVELDYIDFDQIERKLGAFKEISSNVASLRLDSILSCGFGISRSNGSKEIAKGSVKVNWETVTNLSYIIDEGDTISLRGSGRVVLDKVWGITKKGRVNITLKKII